MKEYKVIKPKLGWRNTAEKFEEILNTYAMQGWTVKEVTPNQHLIGYVILERDKNR